jgi:hypothetical protein
MGYSRQRAVSLRAASVHEVLTLSGFSLLLRGLTAAQVRQLQRYLDAVVVDPVVQQEAEAWHRKATRYYGQLAVTDPVMQRRAETVMHDYITIGKFDDRVRLNVARLLAETAFAPETDNPDEADYLARVRKVLDARGVWLRLAPKLVRDAEDRSRWVVDPRHFEVWISLGPQGDRIPTKTGRIGREALLDTVLLGAEYYRAVDNGPILSALGREVNHLSSEIDDGMALHFELARIRREAAMGVVAVADVMGGASFPSEDIWDGPHKLLLRAMDMKTAGKTYGCRTLLVIAAIATRNAAQLLSRYRDSSVSGAERAVKVLKVARTAGKVAEVALMVTGVGALALRGASTVASAAVSEASVDALAEREVARYLAKNPELASEINQVRLVPGPKGTVLGNTRGGHSAGVGTGGFDSW